MAGRIATCTPKNRVSVAPLTSRPPRMNVTMCSPMPGTTPAMLVPTRVAKNASSFHGSRYPLNPNANVMKKISTPESHVSSRGRRYACT